MQSHGPDGPSGPDGPGDPVAAVVADLEQQAVGLHLRDRDDEVDQLGQAEYAEVDLAARLHASVDAQVRLTLVDGLRLRGRLERAGADVAVVVDGSARWLVPTAAVGRADGLSSRAVSEAARPVLARLGMRSMLRRLAEDQVPVVLQLRGGERVEGRLGRVGRDFLEVCVEARRESPAVVAFAALTAVRSAR
jgi:hypothetical protein